MSVLDTLREQRDAHQRELDELVAAPAEGEQRAALTTEDEARVDELLSVIDKYDERIAKAEKTEARKAAATEAHKRTAAPAVVTSEPMTYAKGQRSSYFADLAKAQLMGDVDAAQRLARHAKEVAVEAESRAAKGDAELRDLNRTDGTGGQFVPPLYLVDEYVDLARAGRVTANLVQSRPLPPGTDSINLPKIATGTATAVQATDNGAVQETDLTDANIVAPVRTVAGQQDVAIQLLDQSPIAFDEVIFADLMADYAQKVDVQVLAGTGASGQVTGITAVSGINAVTYTDATPTLGELYSKLADANQRIAGAVFKPAEAVVMHPRRWGWMLAQLDTQNRPLVVPSAQSPMNAVGVGGGGFQEGPVGTLLGLPVYTDANIATNGGAGTNEDYILVLRPSELWLFESAVKSRVLPDVGSGTLTVRLQVYGYLAFQGARRPAAISQVSGTGLVAPTF